MTIFAQLWREFCDADSDMERSRISRLIQRLLA